MNQTLIQLQIFYEIAMMIGKSLDLHEMLKTGFSVYLRRLSCSAGMILQQRSEREAGKRFSPLLTIPRNLKNHPACDLALSTIPDDPTAQELSLFLNQLPWIGKVGEKQFSYILQLPGFGLMVLAKSGQEFNHSILQSLEHLNRKLAESCISCLQSKEIETMNRQLTQEISVRQGVEQQLRDLLNDLESRVEARTQQLQKTNQELVEALANVKTLSGLLPICSHCKMIRDDQGYWKQIESYIEDHSEADFSHSLCPDCFKKYYPELYYPE